MLNIDKTKILVFRKAGILPRNLKFNYNGTELEIVFFFFFFFFTYLGIVLALVVPFQMHKLPLLDRHKKQF